jgi:hypothetical protein
MALWSNSDANTSAPKYAVAGGYGLSETGQDLFDASANTAGDASVLQVFGVDVAEQQATTTSQSGHAGWVLRQTGTGGRAGRVQVETLVAMGSMSGDDEDVVYPDYRIVISSQPQDTSNSVGGAASFSVTAATVPTGGSISYQWSVDANGSGSMVEISGATNSTLSLSDIATENLYRVVLSVTGADNVTSANAALTIDA